MNVHDSEKISGILTQSGYDESDNAVSANIIVLNTCSIRQKAEQKFYSELGRLKRVKEQNPNLRIAVAGCIAQQEGRSIFKRFPHVDFILGPNNIDSLENWIRKGSRSTALVDNDAYHTKVLPVNRVGRVRAWVSIMFGCDNFCAYCVVPYTRGRERSRPPQDILTEVMGLAKEGYKEITLLGQNVNSYSRNVTAGVDFPGLLNILHEVEGIQRIRFVTSHPKDFSHSLIKAVKELPKVCKHIHLPLQAGSDRILSLMNRGYSYAEYKKKIDTLRKEIPKVSITTDIITGFPGETDDDFSRTLGAVLEIEYDGLFAFKYSRRPGTPALDLPEHVDEEVKSQRLSEVLALQESITYRKNKMLEGIVCEVLVEGQSETDPEKLTGRTETNKIVNFHGDHGDVGSIINMEILEAKQHSLLGKKAVKRVQGYQVGATLRIDSLRDSRIRVK